MQTETNAAVQNRPPLTALKRGDGIRITFGSQGSQLAVVHDITRAGNVRVWKWRQKSKAWVGPIRISDSEFISRAREYEFAKTDPLPRAYREFKA